MKVLKKEIITIVVLLILAVIGTYLADAGRLTTFRQNRVSANISYCDCKEPGKNAPEADWKAYASCLADCVGNGTNPE